MQEKGEKVNSSESSNTHQYFTETYLQYNSLCLCFSPFLVSQASRHAYAHTVSPNEWDVKVHRHKHKLDFFLKTFNLVSRLSKLPRYWIEKVPLTAATAVRMFVICAHREWGWKKKEEEAWSKERRNTGSWRLFSDDQRALSDTVRTSLTWRTWGCCTWQMAFLSALVTLSINRINQ